MSAWKTCAQAFPALIGCLAHAHGILLRSPKDGWWHQVASVQRFSLFCTCGIPIPQSGRVSRLLISQHFLGLMTRTCARLPHGSRPPFFRKCTYEMGMSRTSRRRVYLAVVAGGAVFLWLGLLLVAYVVTDTRIRIACQHDQYSNQCRDGESER
jgi:hypothetical protein